MTGKKFIVLKNTDRFFLCFLVGITAGTVMANLLGQDIGKQAGYFGGNFTYGLKMSGSQRLALLGTVCRQRGLELGFAWLAGLTVFAVPCFCIFSAYYGIAAGVLLSVATFQKGLMGLPYYLASILPHYLIYIPVWCILFTWAGRPAGRLRLLSLCGLAVLVLAGALLEAYVNPYVLEILLF